MDKNCSIHLQPPRLTCASGDIIEMMLFHNDDKIPLRPSIGVPMHLICRSTTNFTPYVTNWLSPLYYSGADDANDYIKNKNYDR